MKILGLITEYNPFHFGHKYHLESSKTELNTSHTIAVMSGSFVQRGEPSLIDKFTKAKMAIDNGVDLVLELPSIYSLQSAELFALGAMKILDSTNIVDFISFGSESGDIQPLQKIADILLEEPAIFKETLKENLGLGNSFSVSRSKAVEIAYRNLYPNDDDNINSIIKKSNNILGIEYIKAIRKLKSNIQPFTIERLGHNYNDIDIESKIASATGIRNKVHNDGIHSIRNLVPDASYLHLLEFYNKYESFNYLNRYSQIIDYILLNKSKDSLKEIFDMEEGLENRLIKINEAANSIDELVHNTSTKRYPKTRIQRIIMHLLFDFNKYEIKDIYKAPNEYIRVLGSNQKGLEILKQIKEKSDIHIISKFTDYKTLDNENINLILNYEKKGTDLFYLGINRKEYNKDYLISPYIK